MDDLKVQYCKICYTAIYNEHRTAIENNTKDSDFDNNGKPVMCKVCLEKLHAAQSFQLTCSDSDNAINSYVEDTTILPLDLREIYMKERPGEHISDDTKICRLCMRPIKGVSEFEAINEELVDMIQKFVPEMNIFIIREPVMCKLCTNSLPEHNSFLKKCSDVEQNIKNVSNGQASEASSAAVPSMDISVKIENVENVSNGQNLDTPSTAVPSIDISVKIENIDVEFEEDIPELIKTECLDQDDEKIENESGQETASSLKEHEMQGASDVPMYKCEICDYKSKLKGNVKLHLLIHKDRSEVKMYKCEICNYETRHKTYIKSHKLIHKDPSEMEIYKCEHCDSEFKSKKTLKIHLLIHKDPSEVQMYKCKSCNYENMYEKNLKSHMLIHKDPAEVKTYKCEFCNYEARHKNYLKSHMLKHKDPSEVQMYQCVTCEYKTKYKSDINRHLLKHKSPRKTEV